MGPSSEKPNDQVSGRGAQKLRRAWRPAVAFAVLWAILFTVPMLRDPYFHPPLKLRIVSSLPAERTITVAWDTGQGFNGYQEKPFVLPPAPRPGPFRGTLALTIDGSRNPASQSVEAWIAGLRVQKRGLWTDVKLDDLGRRGGVVARAGLMILTAPGGTVLYDGGFERAEIIAARHRYSGILRIELDGKLVESVDLYHPTGAEARIAVTSPNPVGEAVSEFNLPRQLLAGVRLSPPDTRALGIKSISVIDQAGRELGRTSYTGEETNLTVPIAEFNQSVFTSRLLVFRLVAATLVAALLAIGFAAFKNLAVGAEGRLFQVSYQGRWVFWCGFAVLLLWYATWVAGQWPGFPTFDTYEQLMQVVTLSFSNWNPFVHTLLLDSLYDTFSSLGAVTIFQAIATAGLMTFALYSFWRRGAPIWLVGVTFLLLLASPVVAIYNLVPWRDIPFSLLTIFWTLFIFHLCLSKWHLQQRPSLSSMSIAILGVLLFVVVTARHNGQVFLVLIPLILLGGRLIPWRQTVAMTALAGVLYAVTLGPLARFYDAHRNTNYNLVTYSIILNPLIALLKTSYGVQSVTWDEDIAAISAIVDPEAIKKKYDPVHVLLAMTVPRKSAMTDAAEFRRFTRAFLHLAIQNPEVFLSERLQLFLATIAFRNGGGWYSTLWQPDRAGRSLPPGNMQELYRIHRSPLTTAFEGVQTPILAHVNHPAPYATYFVYFSAFIPFLMVLVLLVLTWRFPACGVANLLILTQCAGLFVASVGNEFRFFYFLYLYGFIAIPMVAAEYVSQRRRRSASHA